MILLDTDVLMIDLRYLRDARYAANRQFLSHCENKGLPLAITCHTLLEVVGKFSFNVSIGDIPKLMQQIPGRYAVAVLPDPTQVLDYAGCTVSEVIAAMEKRMALGDAVNAVQINKYIPAATCLLTWNAKHYYGTLAVPVLTPEEWLNQQPAP